MKKALLIVPILFSVGCASAPDPREFMDLSCQELSLVADSRQGSDLAERADLFNDAVREQERRASGSPFQSNELSLPGQKGGTLNDRIRRDKAAIRAAYNDKGCGR